jgi:Ricin-type beta-trefoil lectin domain/Immunoglobulin I-set domain/Bacterial Ig domain
MTLVRRCLPAIATLLLAFFVLSFLPPAAFATCSAPKNPIEAENCLQGTPASQWYVQGAGSPNIQGFTTDISVNVGQTIFFKISTPATSYRIDIYRVGYYQGNDGRFIASVSPSAPLPQIQPSCLNDTSTGLIDCGNWGISASWIVPSTATSGFYFARLIRLDTGEVGAILFVVRNDSSHSDILEQTSDPTWQAYNNYGGNSLYAGNPVGRAYKVSYNRPVNPAQSAGWDFFIHEYPIVRFLEANGYDVSYSTGVDTDRNGSLITQHKVFLSVGHDEYWSGGQRASVEAARAAGVNLAFLSGNEVFWKTRWEPSIDGTNTPYRTLVCYKETATNGTYPRSAIDPADPPTWTGMWRDGRFSPPADGGRPENALTGMWSAVSAPQDNAITVPQDDGRMRFWRNTSIAGLGTGQVATLPQSTLGYESDEDPDNGFRPAGLIRLSTTTVSVSQYLYFSPTSGYYFSSGNETHHLTLYRAPSGALVFGAGTIHWSWGVESDHVGYSGSPADPNMRQAMVNLFADMGVQPVTLQSGLMSATASTDTTPPRSTVTSPTPGTTVTAGSQVTVMGTAQDFGGGVVGGVEVSVDGGATWHPAVGRESWSYVFTPTTSGTLNALSRAVDDCGNLEVLSPAPTITMQPTNQTVTAGQTATFTAAATGSPTPTVQWQVSTDSGATFNNVSGATSTTLSFTTALSQNGYQYRAVFTNSAGTATTTAATLTVNSPTPPTITTQPANQTVTAGQTATFTAAATGSPTPTVQWQVSTDNGATFSNVSGATSTTLSFATASSQNGYQYRAVFTNSAGTATTTAAMLTVNAAPPGPPSGTVIVQNTNSNLCIDTGGSANFTYLIQSPCSTSNTQKFTLTAAPVSGWYYLVSAASNLCWDVVGGSGSAGALIQQYSCVAVWPEYYQLKGVSGGYEILSGNMSNGCLDVVGASTASGANIEQNTCIGSANQIFNIH